MQHPPKNGVASSPQARRAAAKDPAPADAQSDQGEERLRAIARLSGDWYWEQDADYRFTVFEGPNVGPGMAHDPARVIGKRRWETGSSPLVGTWEDHRKVLDSRMPFYDAGFRIIDQDGREHFVVASGVPFFRSDGTFGGYRGTGHDVTARTRAEKLLRLEHAVARCVTQADSVAAALPAVIQTICEAQNWECGRYFSVDEQAGKLRFSAFWSRPGPQFDSFIERSRLLTYARGEGLIGRVWSSANPMWIADITRDTRAAQRALAAEAGMRGAFVFPVISEEKTMGVLTFSSREIREPDEYLMQAILVIGSQIGEFVRRKHAEEVLRESEERFRSLTELSSDWYWEQDENFRFTMISETVHKRIGNLPYSVIGKTRWELPTLNVSESEWAAHRAQLEAHLPFRDLQWQRKDENGVLHIASVSGEPIFDATGKFRGYRGIGRDITESKQSEEALRRFRASMDMSGDMILLVDRATMRFVDVNETVCRNLGYTREEFLALSLEDILPIPAKQLEVAYDEMIATGAIQRMRSEYRRKDGSALPFESVRRVVRSGDSWTVVIIARDARERIAQEEALRKSSERFDLAVKATNDVIRDWDLKTDAVWWNANFFRAFGYATESSDIKSWYERIHPVDQGRVIAGVHRLIDSAGEDWREEYRFRRQDGTFAYVLDRGHVVRDDAGRALRMIAAMADITQQKEVEQRIHSQALQQRLIAEFGQQAFASTDLDDVMSHAVELASVTLKADYCDLLELDADGTQLFRKAATGRSDDFPTSSSAVPVRPGGPIEFVLARREPLVASDLSQDERFRGSPLLERGVRSSILVPIFGTSGSFGVLNVHAKKTRHFSEEHLSFLQSVANILAVAIERKSAEDRLAYLAQFDALTGLPNRHLFHDQLQKTMANARRTGHPMAVLFIDLDHFKLVNDTQGHSAGDKLLKEAATRLSQCVRSGDTVGRFGGDEFGAIVSELSRPGDAGTIAQKVLDALAQPFRLDAHETYVSASVGITLFPSDGDNPESLVMNADTAMYRAKEQGRNTYQYFTREMNERTLARVKMDAALRHAIERKEFFILYQPKVELASRRICGFEALLRWEHPDRGMVLPGEFVSILEEAGLIVQVGEWVLREVSAQVRSWQSAGLAAMPVTVNLSARQFQQKEFEATVRRVLREGRVDPGLVQFELTESLLMSDPEGAARTLRGLKDTGVKISVDDFGTGYSSLAYLKRFPIDSLKIDRSFVRDITMDPEDEAIALAIIGLAHALKLRVVAEGVETSAQLAWLAANGCDEIQGFYFSVPTTPEECAKMLSENRRLR
jgi:diguanylate cyclase (GGDEF)-like protein/PAS domain S-box-containing protein